jgi:hypothetical protein
VHLSEHSLPVSLRSYASRDGVVGVVMGVGGRKTGQVPLRLKGIGWWVGGDADHAGACRGHTVHARALLSRLPDTDPPPFQLWQPKGDHNHEHKEHCADGICGAAAKYDKYNTHMGMPGH